MIPPYWKLCLPILNICKNKQKIHRSELEKELTELFELTQEERNRPKSSGGETLFKNRIAWATFDLRKAKLIDGERGFVSITDDGRNILEKNPKKIDRNYLRIIPAYREFLNKMEGEEKEHSQKTEEITEQSPEDMIITGHDYIRKNIERELLEKINENTPEFFETLVVKLIRKMRYGINHTMVGRVNDGGIDGIIKEDKLGFDEIYLQAKRWKQTVPVDKIREFAGALATKKSDKGIFITTADFSVEAYNFVENVNVKIILINGEKLIKYMYEYNLGVNVVSTYEIKKIDEGYFSDN